MNPNSRSPWADWFRFMKSMSIVGPREVAVELRVQVDQRLVERRSARRSTSWPARTCASRRSRRRRSSAASASRQHAGDRLRRRDDGLRDDADRDLGALVEAGGDDPGVLGDLLEDLRPVQVLAAGDEPDLEVAAAQTSPFVPLDRTSSPHLTAPWVKPET